MLAMADRASPYDLSRAHLILAALEKKKNPISYDAGTGNYRRASDRAGGIEGGISILGTTGIVRPRTSSNTAR
mgnify:CR=1 FL=1